MSITGIILHIKRKNIFYLTIHVRHKLQEKIIQNFVFTSIFLRFLAHYLDYTFVILQACS